MCDKIPQSTQLNEIIKRITVIEKGLINGNNTNKQYIQYSNDLDEIYNEAANIAPKVVFKNIIDENMYNLLILILK